MQGTSSFAPQQASRFLFLVIAATAALLAVQKIASADILGLQRVASGLNRPIYATHAPGDNDRLFVVERNGAIKILDLETGATNPQNFLSIGGISTSGEGGLLSMAFHSDYQSNGKFYVYATIPNGAEPGPFNSHIREYTVSANPDIADTQFRDVLTFSQPQDNHNGGWIGFSPNDGYLYIGTGDGGNGNDQGTGHTPGTGNAQDRFNNLLGKMLRIDVDGSNGPNGEYGIPDSNPFVNAQGDDEIWAYGLRNPWRSSFDSLTGDLWIGDVGQGAREEIDFQSADSEGGENYGWRLREGDIATPGVGGPPPARNVDPVYDYNHRGGAFAGNSTVGGYLYRGPDPDLKGMYFFADSVSGNRWMFDPADPDGTVDNINAELTPDVGSLNGIVSFAEDGRGNLYIIDIASSLFGQPANTGEIFRIVTEVPEPSTWILAVAGATLLAMRRKRPTA